MLHAFRMLCCQTSRGLMTFNVKHLVSNYLYLPGQGDQSNQQNSCCQCLTLLLSMGECKRQWRTTIWTRKGKTSTCLKTRPDHSGHIRPLQSSITTLHTAQAMPQNTGCVSMQMHTAASCLHSSPCSVCSDRQLTGHQHPS